ncbi:MAG: hypothetical protein AABZ44_00750 [Elusimicrobiota bacterium]
MQELKNKIAEKLGKGKAWALQHKKTTGAILAVPIVTVIALIGIFLASDAPPEQSEEDLTPQAQVKFITESQQATEATAAPTASTPVATAQAMPPVPPPAPKEMVKTSPRPDNAPAATTGDMGFEALGDTTLGYLKTATESYLAARFKDKPKIKTLTAQGNLDLRRAEIATGYTLDGKDAHARLLAIELSDGWKVIRVLKDSEVFDPATGRLGGY